MVFFRAPDLGSALHAVQPLVLFRSPGSEALANQPAWWAFLGGLAVVHAGSRRFSRDRLARVPNWIFAALYGSAAALAFAFVSKGYTPFIYFQF